MNEKISNFFKDQQNVSISIGVVSFGAGIGLGYILGKRNRTQIIHAVPVQQKFDYEAMEQFIEEKEIELDIHHEEPEEAVPDKVALGQNFVAEKLSTVSGNNDEEPTVVAKSIFAESDDDWDFEIESKKRSRDAPYILHKDEFYADEMEYTQHTLTYYAGDNILVDEEDTPIYNHSQVVGDLLFGHGSGDPKVVYIRNDRQKAEYEILHDPGLYSVEVLGLEIENNERAKDIKHSQATPKFRSD